MTNEEMMNSGMQHRKKWGRKMFFIVPLVLLAIALASTAVMLLWNAIVPGLFPTLNIGTLTFCKALGLLVLSKILFGGFRRGGHYGGWKQRRMQQAAWKEKWMHMSDEEKAKFKEQWQERCKGRW